MQRQQQAALLAITALELGVGLDALDPLRVQAAAFQRQVHEGGLFRLDLADRRQHPRRNRAGAASGPLALQHYDALASAHELIRAREPDDAPTDDDNVCVVPLRHACTPALRFSHASIASANSRAAASGSSAHVMAEITATP